MCVLCCDIFLCSDIFKCYFIKCLVRCGNFMGVSYLFYLQVYVKKNVVVQQKVIEGEVNYMNGMFSILGDGMVQYLFGLIFVFEVMINMVNDQN